MMHPRLLADGHWKDPHDGPRLVVLSGAGLSAESGLSLYRAADGLWENHKIEEVCDARTWRQHRAQVHAFYNDRRRDGAAAQPNVAHRMLASLEHDGAVLVTQNVDPLLERAGAQSVIHLHGFIQDMQCTACHRTFALQGDTWAVEDPCPFCHDRQSVKPGVVFFHEAAPEYGTLANLLSGLRANDVVVTLGTSGTVVSPLMWLHSCRAQRWLANLQAEPTLPDDFFARIWYGPITQTMPALVEAWQTHRRGTAGER